MKNFVSAGSVLVLALLLVLSFAGCGGVSKPETHAYTNANANTTRRNTDAHARSAWDVRIFEQYHQPQWLQAES